MAIIFDEQTSCHIGWTPLFAEIFIELISSRNDRVSLLRLKRTDNSSHMEQKLDH